MTVFFQRRQRNFYWDCQCPVGFQPVPAAGLSVLKKKQPAARRRSYNQIMQKKRYQELRHELDRIVKVLVKDYSPEKIILYGSAAHGKVKRWSDLDIVVIKNTDRRFYDRIGDVLHITRPHEAVDFLVYTPKEFTDMQKYNYFITQEVIQGGEVVYDKDQ